MPSRKPDLGISCLGSRRGHPIALVTCDKKYDTNKTDPNRFHRMESASVSNPAEDKIVMNSVRNYNFAKLVWPKTENFVDMRSGSDQTDARTRG